jgi:two-component system OmpR family response regulator
MIEDDIEFSLFLGEYLEKYNMKITNFQDPYLALIEKINDYDLLILDLTLPGMDGLDICKKISSKFDIPIIISSARSDVSDKVIGLQVGADYYLPKPYDPKEMYAVIKSLLRRVKRIEHSPQSQSLFKFDEDKRSISFRDKPLLLTQAEYEVMISLLKHKNSIVSREQIINECDSLSDVFSKSLDVIIGRLRTKLNDSYKDSKYLHSFRGLGYKLSQ